jgi:hypothetical protein
MTTIKRSRARNLNDPQHWQAWLVACLKDEWTSKKLRVPGHLAMLTGQDSRVLGAIACCWRVYANSDDAGQYGAIEAVRALLPALQPSCRGFARELIAQSLDWNDREPVWALVMDRYRQWLATLTRGADSASERAALARAARQGDAFEDNPADRIAAEFISR